MLQMFILKTKMPTTHIFEWEEEEEEEKKE